MTMEKRPNFVLKLSLEEMALRRVVANVCNETDVFASNDIFQIESINTREFDVICEPAVDQIKDKVSRLVLPELLKKRMAHLVKPLLIEIFEWKIFHGKFFFNSDEHFDASILKLMCWTSVGSVDYQKTAEKLARAETLHVVKRYELACLHCLVDHIPILWEELPDEVKRAELARYPTLGRDTYLEYYWAQCLKGKDSDINSTYLKDISFTKDAFEFAARTGNESATKFFFQKLSNGKQDSFVFRTIHFIIAERCRNLTRQSSVFSKRKLSKVLCYLLSTMSSEHQVQALKACRCEVLCCFLDWPLQDLFLDIAAIIWTFLPESKYDYLLGHITSVVKESGYYFPNLIQEFFVRSPVDFRKHFLRKLHCFVSEFSYVEDTETLQIIFRNVDLGNRTRLVSGLWFPRLLKDLMRRDKGHLVKLCIRETSLSEEEKKILKENVARFSSRTCSELENFFDILDKTGATELRISFDGRN
ncbi:uncharacterized protein LOC129957074 [Argiope bruennichi]|uniref:uncharacterized protein LOC129957074 n=1 Tax=Argiope bruennichi TaxID=94029 RepID=UPI0024956E75|nr:uncharacterized protein LOC129957074 [Argiope bruennichi]XP_055925187.1 uncharacterized protein LOC129957074 [Argiope bruennichi]XP_055925188.1 uncharacterized protein LOC129957074 [Argiope bruennichi]XP_055925189.1 uncharacterized protein LOC129957074 [Argiope bruennichi]